MKILDIEQGSDEWLELRKTKITGTDIAAIFGISPWKNAYDLWREKLGLLPPTAVNYAMRRGTEYEDEARASFEALQGNVKYPAAVILSTAFPWLMSSLDGLNGHFRIVTEFKVPLPHNFESMCENPIPNYYMTQMQNAFAASDRFIENGFFCVYSPELKKIHKREVVADNKMIDKIYEESKIFHDRLKNYDPPPPPHMLVETDQARNTWDLYKLAVDMEKQAKEMRQEAKEKLLILADGESISSWGNKLTLFMQQGRVDYKKIPELKDVDLAPYRGKSIECSRITLKK